MLKTYLIESGAGGVGNTFVARCIVSMLVNAANYEEPIEIDNIFVVDVDPCNADLCSEVGIIDEVINKTKIFAIRHPIRTTEDWFDIVNLLDQFGVFSNEASNRVVFSVPQYSSLSLLESSWVIDLFDMLNLVPVWVLGPCKNSVINLEKRLRAYPKFYCRGMVVRNLKLGVAERFLHWNNSILSKELIDSGWQIVDLPVLNPLISEEIGAIPFLLLDKAAHAGPFTYRFRHLEKI
ncbi:MAG: hypothetical protein ACYC3O_07245 [Burkholderiales bacterium]